MCQVNREIFLRVTASVPLQQDFQELAFAKWMYSLFKSCAKGPKLASVIIPLKQTASGARAEERQHRVPHSDPYSPSSFMDPNTLPKLLIEWIHQLMYRLEMRREPAVTKKE